MRMWTYAGPGMRFLGRALWIAALLQQRMLACPLCHTETGRQVRAGIFDAHFGGNLLYTLSPFPVFLLVVALLYFGFPTAKDEDSGCPDMSTRDR